MPRPCVGTGSDSESAGTSPYLGGAMKKPRDVIQPRWGAYLLKRTAERLPFTVTGRNGEEPIERAIKERLTFGQ